MTDAKAFIAGSISRRRSRRRKIGTQGYCMGGPSRSAPRRPCPLGRRRGVVPRRRSRQHHAEQPALTLAAATKAQFLVAIAARDDQRALDEKTVLKDTFAKAGLTGRSKSTKAPRTAVPA